MTFRIARRRVTIDELKKMATGEEPLSPELQSLAEEWAADDRRSLSKAIREEAMKESLFARYDLDGLGRPAADLTPGPSLETGVRDE